MTAILMTLKVVPVINSFAEAIVIVLLNKSTYQETSKKTDFMISLFFEAPI